MDDGVFHLSGLAVVLEQVGDVGGLEDLNEAVDYPFDAVVDIGSGDVAKEFAQEGV